MILEAKVKGGTASREERERWQRSPILIGGGAIVVPRPFTGPDAERDFEEWARAEEARLEADPSHPCRKPPNWRPNP